MKFPPTVLVVEDDFELRWAVCHILEEAGFRTFAASDGAEAIRRLANGKPPDLILLDLRMPVMNGWEFGEEVRKDPACAEIPVIVMSGGGSFVDSLGGAALKPVATLTKPFNLGDLVETVRRHFGDGSDS